MRVIEGYPVALVNAVLRGLRQEAIARNVVSSLEAGPHVDEPDVWRVCPEYYNEIYDAISGRHLDPALVSLGRKDEMQFLTELGAYAYDTLSNCKAAGCCPVPTVWVDINKRDYARPNVRCRLCVAETKGRTTLDLGDPSQTFSAAPQYEALRFLVSMAMSP